MVRESWVRGAREWGARVREGASEVSKLRERGERGERVG